ncbi:MAG TPA: hypothetical protein VMC84_06200 [Methanocella sp.]|nr:hypothetical protein [Methanocella sp.]HTY90754.1 hypothetical protein [Methanocella sp.]
MIDGAKRQVYLDDMATTQVSDEILDAMLPYFNRRSETHPFKHPRST